MEEYASLKGLHLEKGGIKGYIRTISERVVDRIAGVEYGLVSSFLQVVRAIALNFEVVLASMPLRFKGIPGPVHVGIFIKLGWKLGPTLLKFVNEREQLKLEEVAKVIYLSVMLGGYPKPFQPTC